MAYDSILVFLATIRHFRDQFSTPIRIGRMRQKWYKLVLHLLYVFLFLLEARGYNAACTYYSTNNQLPQHPEPPADYPPSTTTHY